MIQHILLAQIPHEPLPDGNTSVTQQLRYVISNELLGSPGSANLKVGDLATKLLPYLYIIGGMILFAMLVWGGFEMLTGVADTKAQESGKQRITTAVIGFLLLFVSYWLIQLIQIVFKINILG